MSKCRRLHSFQSPYLRQRIVKREDERTMYQFVTPDSEYLTFMSGKYVCPGRFMASSMIKLMMVAVLLLYHFKGDPASPEPSQNYLHAFAFAGQLSLFM